MMGVIPTTFLPTTIPLSTRRHALASCSTQDRQNVARPPRAAVTARAAAAVPTIPDVASHIYGIPRAEWLKLQVPSRYLGNEFGAVHKPWNDAQVRFALTYPELYEVGSSNLGHVILYGLLNRADGVLCDRAYFPGSDLTTLLQRYDKPLFAIESKQPLASFDSLGFSLSYELGGANILEMLHQARIPLTWQQRQEAPGTAWDVSKGSWPLVFAGGPTATSNPEPFANFMDFFALGDGEELLVEIAQSLKASKAAGLDRDATLFALATSVKGVYVPQFYERYDGWGGAVLPTREGVPERIVRRVCDPDPMDQIGLVPMVATVHDRLTVEIRRGCTRGCRFCQPGMLTRPARDVEPERAVAAVEHGVRKTGYSEASLLSLSCSDYLSLPSVGISIKNRFKDDEAISLSLPSQRVDRFDTDIANIIATGAKRGSITFAPEAGTQRMRDVINKGLTNEELLRGVKTAWDEGWRQVKLYFMIGLPGETDEDVLGIADTIRWLQRSCRQGPLHLAVHVTISNFTPKPHTPFQVRVAGQAHTWLHPPFFPQWHSVSTAEFVRKQQMLRAAFASMYQVKANFTDVKISAIEDFVGRGDRRIGDVMLRAWELGATNDGWWMNPDSCYQAWDKAIQDAGMVWKYRQVQDGEWNVLEALGDARYRKQGSGGKGRVDRGEHADARLDMPLPWDHVDTGIAKWWLKADLQRALEAATIPDCSHSSICTECGVCGDEFGDNVTYQPPLIPPFEGQHRPNTTAAQRVWLAYTKGGDMVFVGHLDTMRLFERACRRAALPLTHDKSPFRARPRIATALPLPLGATSDAEVLELLLTRPLPLDELRTRLQAQLPTGVQLLQAREVPIYKADGSNYEKLGALLESVEYHVLLTRAAEGDGVLHEQGGGCEGRQQGVGMSLQEAVAAAVKDPVYSKPETHTMLHAASLLPRCPNAQDKKRNNKLRDVDVGGALLALELLPDPAASPLAHWAGDVLRDVAADEALSAADWGAVRLRTRCEGGNPVVTPTVLCSLLARASGAQWSAAHVHRSAVEIGESTPPKIDSARLRSILLWEGHVAMERLWRKSGPWAGGIEGRPMAASSNER